METLNGISAGGPAPGSAFYGGYSGRRASQPSPAAQGRKGDDSTGLRLTPQQQDQVRELQARDQEVRAHERAHVSAAGGLASAPSYEYQTGPDGRRYAVGGEVQVKTASGRTPEETIENARKVGNAAHAPHSPSGPDMLAAAEAAQMEAAARMEKNGPDAADPRLTASAERQYAVSGLAAPLAPPAESDPSAALRARALNAYAVAAGY